jgi:hypothetical protein
MASDLITLSIFPKRLPLWPAIWVLGHPTHERLVISRRVVQSSLPYAVRRRWSNASNAGEALKVFSVRGGSGGFRRSGLPLHHSSGGLLRATTDVAAFARGRAWVLRRGWRR